MERELRQLGEQPRREVGGVTWTGNARSVMRANLWLRTASKVLVRVAQFHARTFAELERYAKRIEWSRWTTGGADFSVTSKKSKLIHTGAIAERLSTAIGSRVSAVGGRKSTDSRHTTPDTQQFIVRAIRDEFEISVDSSGALLHMRGYRQAIGKAPLRETLAAALLLGAEWDGTTPLLDPFCGSGTIPIEAALIARNIAPGLNRSFAFENWPGFEAAVLRALRDDARAAMEERAAVTIAGSDRDAGAIAASRANAERAGVAADVVFAKRAVSAVEPIEGTGLVATNPPYGVRASANKDVRDVYAALGNAVRKNLGGWGVALYAPEERLAAQTRLATTPIFRTTNGGIGVTAWRASPPTE